MSNDDKNAVLSSLNDLEVDSESGAAKVKKSARKKGKVKKQSWGSDESAGSLLAGILDETGVEAKAEQASREAERKAREEAEKRKKEEAELQRKLKGSQALAEERARNEELDRQRAEMEAKLERERMIEQGLIDPEEEARAKAEAEAARIAEERDKKQKDAALSDAQVLIQQQQAALKKMTEASMTPVQPDVVEIPQKSNTGLIVGILALLLIAGAGVGAFLYMQPKASDAQVVLEGGSMRSVRARTTEGAMAGLGHFTREGEKKAVDAVAAGGAKSEGKTSKKKRRSRKKRKKDKDTKRGGNSFDLDSGTKGTGDIVF